MMDKKRKSSATIRALKETLKSLFCIRDYTDNVMVYKGAAGNRQEAYKK
jgi:hypothetical protein